MSQFQVGDVVQLKSGGPIMTVADPASQGTNGPVVRCEWFDTKGFKQESTFKEEVLDRYDSSPQRIIDTGNHW